MLAPRRFRLAKPDVLAIQRRVLLGRGPSICGRSRAFPVLPMGVLAALLHLRRKFDPCRSCERSPRASASTVLRAVCKRLLPQWGSVLHVGGSRSARLRGHYHRRFPLLCTAPAVSRPAWRPSIYARRLQFEKCLRFF